MQGTTGFQRLYLDFSQTAGSSYQTGIQRVVRKLVEHLPQVSSERGIEFIPCVFVNGEFYRYEDVKAVGLGDTFQILKQEFSSKLPPWYRNGVKPLAVSQRLRRLLLPEPGHLGAFSLPIKTLRAMRKFVNKSKLLRPISFGPEDSMILGECYWGNRRDIFEAAARIRQEHGLTIQSIVYDLIPITHQHFFDEHTAKHFRSYIELLTEHSNVVTAISKTVRDELRAKLTSEFFGTSNANIHSFRLGCEVVSKPGKVREQLKDILSHDGHRVHLMVSTFEPRKNHKVVLDAFEKMWTSGQGEAILFAGRVGWNIEHIIERCRSLNRVGNPLYVFHDLTDTEIDYCYRNCETVIFPSEVEGFGLPIVEGLWHQKPTFVGDTKISREVGKEDCFYFDIHDASELVRLIESYAKDKTKFLSTNSYQLTRWADSARELLDVLIETRQSSRVFVQEAA